MLAGDLKLIKNIRIRYRVYILIVSTSHRDSRDEESTLVIGGILDLVELSWIYVSTLNEQIQTNRLVAPTYRLTSYLPTPTDMFRFSEYFQQHI
jgi:hypothetical protein